MHHRGLVCGLVAIGLAACDVGSATVGPTPDVSVPEVKGRDVGATGYGSDPAWATTGDDVAFVAADFKSVTTLRVSSNSARTIPTSANEQSLEVALSADALETFTTSFGRDVTVRAYSASGFPVVLTTRGTGGLGYDPAEGRAMIASASQALVAYLVAPDSVFLRRRDGGAVFLARGCVGLLTFSPDDAQIACTTSAGRGTVATVRLAGGGVTPMPVPASVATHARIVHWDGAGLSVVYDSAFTLLRYSIASAQSRLIFRSGPDGSIAAGSVAWSGDGRTIGFSTTKCTQSEGQYACLKSQHYLYTLDVASGVTTRVAVHNGGPASAVYSGWGRFALSSSGKIAYVLNGRLYLLDQP